MKHGVVVTCNMQQGCNMHATWVKLQNQRSPPLSAHGSGRQPKRIAVACVTPGSAACRASRMPRYQAVQGHTDPSAAVGLQSAAVLGHHTVPLVLDRHSCGWLCSTVTRRAHKGTGHASHLGLHLEARNVDTLLGSGQRKQITLQDDLMRCTLPTHNPGSTWRRVSAC